MENPVACVASISVWLQSKERPRKGKKGVKDTQLGSHCSDTLYLSLSLFQCCFVMAFWWTCPSSRPTLKGAGKRRSSTTCQNYSFNWPKFQCHRLQLLKYPGELFDRLTGTFLPMPTNVLFFVVCFVFLGILFLPVNTMKVGQTGDPMWLGIGTLWIMDLTEILLVWNTLPVHSVYCEIFNFLGDKFVTLLETYGEIRFIALRVLQTSKGFWVFLFYQSF